MNDMTVIILCCVRVFLGVYVRVKMEDGFSLNCYSVFAPVKDAGSLCS